MRYTKRYFESLSAHAYRASRDAATRELRRELEGAWAAINDAWREAIRNDYRLAREPGDR
jgi:hypothetical protein